MMGKDLVQARMINEVLYCERLMYLERVQGEFEHNYFTVDGNVAHKRADIPGGELPPLDDDVEDRPYKARSVWLSSETLGITAKIDVVDGESDGSVVPVEYKRGKPPDVPEGAYLPERAQVCAQVLLLREHGYRVPHGDLYFAAAKRRVSIVIDDVLVATTLVAAARVRDLTTAAEIPPPLVDSPKCSGCSLSAICLPDEVNFLRGRAADLKQLRVQRDDKAPLYVQEQGARVGLSGECLVVKSKDETKTEVRLAHTSHVCLYGNVQVSTQALRELVSRGIQVSLFTTGGWYCGRAIGSDSKNAELRIAQFKTFSDPVACLRLARGIVSAKIKNCRTMLRRNGEMQERVLNALDISANNTATISSSSEILLGMEGHAARIYFKHFSKMLRPPSGSLAFDFESRNRRPPKDPVNALLSLAYAFFAKDCAVALAAVGLDPLVGFYHQLRQGRPSLALDIMEEFRPIIADSVVVTAINTGVVGEGDFKRVAGAVALTPSARRNFIQAYERRMCQEVTHPVFGYRLSYRRVLEVQARLLTRVLLGEIEEYPQFLTR